MFKFLKSLFNRSAENSSSDKLTENEAAESKKCLNCLRRIEFHWVKCPHCHSSRFSD